MTTKDIDARIAAIHAVRGDEERAHSMEDDLFQDVLRAIAKGKMGGERCAKLAEAADAIRAIDIARVLAGKEAE